MKIFRTPFLSLLLFGIATGSAAAQDDPNPTLEELTEKSRELADRARQSGEAFVDSEMVANMADLLSGLADRVEIDREEGTVLRLDGEEVLRFEINRDRAADDALTITGLGRNLTVERETVIQDGKTRTRIVIEMDGGEAAKVEWPDPTEMAETPSDQDPK